MGGEARLWEWLKDALPLGHYSRVESPDTSPGFPDVDCQITDGTGNSLSFKMELKHSRTVRAKHPFSDKTGVRKSQKVWWRDYTRHEGVGWFVCEIAGFVYIIPGKHAKIINGVTINEIHKMSECILDRANLKDANNRLDHLFKKAMYERHI